jgi:drug/metabolite transporter superfamily protein YnfA
MSLVEIGGAIPEAIYPFIDAVVDFTFTGNGLAAVLGFIGIFVAFALTWASAQDIREWRQKRRAMKDAPN